MTDHPPETREGAAWELFMEIRRAEEKEGQNRSRGQPALARRTARPIRRVSRGHHRPPENRRRSHAAPMGKLVRTRVAAQRFLPAQVPVRLSRTAQQRAPLPRRGFFLTLAPSALCLVTGALADSRG